MSVFRSTSDLSPTMRPLKFGLKAINSFVGVALVTASLTVLFLCARAVMDVGGACGSGGPYVVAQPCPEGVGWLTPVSILGGLVSLGWLLYWNSGMPGPKWVLLGWPALFLSLGWNFWEYGLDAPGGRGADAGWIVCGVIFVLMGGLPLLALRSPTARRATFWSDAGQNADRPSLQPTPRTLLHAVEPKFATAGFARPTGAPAGATQRDAESDLVGELHRLAELHRSGALSDREFAIAKQRVLGAT